MISASPARHLTGAAQQCDGGHLGALLLVPADATAVGGVAAGALVNLPFYAAHRSSIEVGEFKRFVAAAAACELGPATWRSATFATDPAKSNNTLVLRAEGIGKPERLTCLSAQLAASGNPAPFTMSATEGQPELVFTDGSRGWVVNGCTVVIASSNWIDATKARIAGRGRSVLDGALMPVVARAGERKHVWMAGALASGLGGGGGLFADAQDFAASIDLTGGFAFSLSFQFLDAAAARGGAKLLRDQFDMMKGLLPQLGLPAAVIDTVGISDAGQFVTLGARGNESDLEAVRQALAKMILGGS